jgi:nitroreductase/dihydropteridine reductase
MSKAPIIEQLKWRAAVKKYDPTKKLTEEQINTLLEAANLSPSAYGLQPYRFYVVSDDKTKAAMAEVGYHQPQFTTASHIIVFASAKTITHDDVNAFAANMAKTRGVDLESIAGYAKDMHHFVDSNDDASLEMWSSRQVYIPLGVLVAAASTLEIDSSPMQGFNPEALDALLGIDKDGFKSGAVVAVGYRSPEDVWSTWNKTRKPFNEIVKMVAV